jgi:hypothetical protein
MGTCSAAPGVFGKYCDFIMTLQGGNTARAAQSAVAMFDSLLRELNQIAPVAGRVALSTTGVGVALEKVRVLSEIDRQLFLQFLEAELTFLRQHMVMKADDLWKRVKHDISVCHRKQLQISAALIRMFNVEGIDKGFSTALVAQRFETFKAFVVMKITAKELTAMWTVDDFLNNRETAAVRKILEQLLDLYVDDHASPDFNAHEAWMDLRQRWDGWAKNHGERIVSFKQLWAATGGGSDVGSNPTAHATIDAYYHKLYEEIEGGNFQRFLSQATKSDPWAS